MGLKEDVLALAEELDSVSVKENCEACLASGTELCRGNLECAESAHKACAKRLRAIAEHDADDVTTVSAYDLLSDDDREALAWVREMGGVEAAKASIHQGAMEHGCLLKVAEMLGTSIYDGTGNADALLDKLEKRLMPKGMEWPKVDGEPVVIGERMRSCGIEDCKVVGIDPANARLFLAFDDIEKGRAVYFPDLAKDCHRPAPKVLDADGEEIRAGDKLYSIEDGSSVTVESVEPGNPWFATVPRELQHCAKFTHRAPVLAADGEPLEVGQTVWNVNNGMEFTVSRLPKPGEYQAVEVRYRNGSSTSFDPDQLTHQRPVLDADGVEVHKGDEVWSTTGEFDGKRTVSSVHIDPDEPPYATFEERQKPYSCLCCYLIHRAPVLAADGKPLEAGQTVYGTRDLEPVEIVSLRSKEYDGVHTVFRYATDEEVRRCKALAEKENRNE